MTDHLKELSAEALEAVALEVHKDVWGDGNPDDWGPSFESCKKNYMVSVRDWAGYFIRSGSLIPADQGRVEELQAAIEADRTQLAKALGNIRRSREGHAWIFEGRGPYEWDDDDFRKECLSFMDEIDAALDDLKVVGRDWSNCPTDPEKRKDAVTSVSQARLLKAELQPLKKYVSDLANDWAHDLGAQSQEGGAVSEKDTAILTAWMRLWRFIDPSGYDAIVNAPTLSRKGEG